MAVSLSDVLLPGFMIICASPAAVAGFRAGIPIEIIVFALLLVGYKGPRWLKRCRGSSSVETSREHAETAPNELDSHEQSGQNQAKGDKQSKGAGWRANLPSFRPKNKTAAAESSDAGSWRRAAAENKKNRPEEPKLKDPAKSALSILKKAEGPEQKWRGIINKFTPEKFDKLCEQLLETLPKNTETNTVDAEQYNKILDGLLSLIFDASSRQHQYTEMYTNLCAKLLDFVSTQQPGLDGRGAIWGRCQQIFLDVVLKAPVFPEGLEEDELMDKKAKHKHMMVGMVKFGGDLVSHGLVPVDGVMHWIHALLSERHLSAEGPLDPITPRGSPKRSPEDAEEDDRDDGTKVRSETGAEKAMEEREVQLEVLCAILASMGSSLNDRTTWSEDNRRIIEDVFQQLEELTMDTKNLSTRMRCLIRDILDLRMAQWKEKEGKLKPQKLLDRNADDNGLNSDAPEFSPGANGWRSDRNDSGKPWHDPTLLEALQVVEHHLEVIDDKGDKLSRLKSLIQLYHFIQEQQLVIVVNTSNVRRVSDLISESFKEVDFRVLDFSSNEATRREHIKSFEKKDASILVMASEISTRRDFDFTPAAVLVNFDFPMTLVLYFYRIHKRAGSKTHVYTFFSPQFDIRHAVALTIALEAAKQKVPAALLKLKEQVKVEGTPSNKDSGNRRDGGDRRTPKHKSSESCSKSIPEADDDGGQRADGGGHPWKKNASEADGRTPHRDRDRDDRGARGDHEDRFRPDRNRSDTLEGEERGDRAPREDRRGGKGSGKGEKTEGRRDGNHDGSWREDITGSPSLRPGAGDDQQVRRRDTARRNPEQAGDQRGGGNNNNNRRVDSGGGRRERSEHGDGAGERRRPQRSNFGSTEGADGIASRTSGQAVSSGQRFERTASHAESNSERWSGDGQNSASSTVRQRRPEQHDSSHADADCSRRPPRVGGGDAGESGNRERGQRGTDKQGERVQPGSVQIQTRGGNENQGHRRGARQGDSRG